MAYTEILAGQNPEFRIVWHSLYFYFPWSDGGMVITIVFFVKDNIPPFILRTPTNFYNARGGAPGT
jgi:hypothetical protein